MTTTHLIPPDVAALYEVHEWRNAVGVLTTAHQGEWDISSMRFGSSDYCGAKFSRGEAESPSLQFASTATLRGGGGSRSNSRPRSQSTRRPSSRRPTRSIATRTVSPSRWSGTTRPSSTTATSTTFGCSLTLEQSTSASSLLVPRTFSRYLIGLVGKSYGPSTTHLDKLAPRIEGGGGGGCPIVVLGMTRALYVEDAMPSPSEIADAAEEDGEGV
jgi:hypothetical protein